jgi:hypothetical protein
MIDVHMIVKDDEPWIKACVASLTDDNVNLRTVRHIDGNIGQARTMGFWQGHSKYVSYIDPDDVPVPGVFDLCEKWLDAHPHYSACFTDEVTIDSQGREFSPDSNHWAYQRVEDIKTLAFGIHHVVVYRREKLEKCLPCKSKLIAENVLNMEMIVKHKMLFGHIAVIGYKWRIHDKNACEGFSNETIEEAKAIIERMSHGDTAYEHWPQVIEPMYWESAEKAILTADQVDSGLPGWMTDKELAFLAEKADFCDSAVEVGSWKGRSTKVLLDNCKGPVYAVDNWQGSDMLRALTESQDVYTEFLKNVGHYPNLKVIKGDSVNMAASFNGVKVDMVFIDAGHSYEDCKADIAAWAPKARRIIAGHDYSPEWPGVMKAVNEAFGKVDTVGSIWWVER